jgi:DNA repair protein RecO (recombination protein O)
MLVKTEGILVYKVKYSETSIIFHLLTKELGLRAFIAKGVRSKKSKTAAALFDYLNVLQIVASQGAHSDLLTIREVSLSKGNFSLNLDPVQNAIYLFVAEFIHKVISKPMVDASLYHFVEHSIQYFSQSNRIIADFHLWFITKFTTFLGITPVDNFAKTNSIFSIQHSHFVSSALPIEGAFSESSSQMLHYYMTVSVDQCGNNLEPLSARNQYLDEMLYYYRFHLDHFSGLQSHEILKSVFIPNLNIK